jgi:ribosome-associated protein
MVWDRGVRQNRVERGAAGIGLGSVLRITDDLSLPESELDERFVRASGPGGQNVNKVSTAVELRFDIAASSLPEAVKARLVALGGRRVSAEGVLQIDSRTQAQNREAARLRLAELVAAATRVPKRRRPTRPKAAAKEARLATKKRRATVKSLRRFGGDD